MDDLNLPALLDVTVSHALATGRFEQVNGHEPEHSPGTGLTGAVWAEDITPVRTSGLASTSVLLVLNVRLYMPMTSEPADAIDPAMTAAVDELCRAYVGSFTFGGLVRQVDVRGAHGVPLRARAGYLKFPDGGGQYRVYTITLPLVVNDLWDEVA